MTHLFMSLRAEHLFKCRVVIARLGEMDKYGAGWWNTNGLLTTVGASALRRNFPFTHWFAQARAVIAAATSRSGEVFPLPQNCVSLWKLAPEVEAQLLENWPDWLKDAEAWRPFFESVANVQEIPVDSALQNLHLARPEDVAAVVGLKRSHEGKALLLPTREPVDDAAVTRMALGFGHGDHGHPVIPYMRVSEGLS
jgi:hypothetical protein